MDLGKGVKRKKKKNEKGESWSWGRRAGLLKKYEESNTGKARVTDWRKLWGDGMCAEGKKLDKDTASREVRTGEKKVWAFKG